MNVKHQKQKNVNQKKSQPATRSLSTSVKEPASAESMLQPKLEEGLYAQVRQDEQLHDQHVARLLETEGYSHLSADGASDMVEQMLRLCTLMYEMLQIRQGTADEDPVSDTTEQKALRKAQKYGKFR